MLDIRSVFPRVFEVVSDVPPHDVPALVCIHRSGPVTLEAVSTRDFPGRDRWASTDGADEPRFCFNRIYVRQVD